MPALTISTDAPPTSSRSSSPTRPPMSPITPTKEAPPSLTSGGQTTATSSSASAAAAAAPSGRPSNYPPNPAALSYSSHRERTQTMAPPPPVPIDFDSNPDAIALKSAISILQMQSRRAADHIRSLSKAKEEALEHPEEFIADLTARVQKSPAARTPASDAAAPRRGQGDSDDDDEDDDDGDEPSQTDSKRAWADLPGPQNVVRCPPINWGQYAVVGDSLDRVHREQVARPPSGAPAVYTTSAGYEFKGNGAVPDQYKGISAPYDPLNDNIEPQGPTFTKK